MPSSDFFDRGEAEAIAKKLGAEISEGRGGHDKVLVRWQGTIIGRYGMRRGSKASHPYIPEQIGVTLREAIDLARCPLSRAGYFALMKDRGKLPTTASSPTSGSRDKARKKKRRK